MEECPPCQVTCPTHGDEAGVVPGLVNAFEDFGHAGGGFGFVPVEAVYPNEVFGRGVGFVGGEKVIIREVGGFVKVGCPQAGVRGTHGVLREVRVIHAHVEITEHVLDGGERELELGGGEGGAIVGGFEDKGVGGGDAALAHEEDGFLVGVAVVEPALVEGDARRRDAVGGGGRRLFVATGPEFGHRGIVGVGVPVAKIVRCERGVDEIQRAVLVLEFVGEVGRHVVVLRGQINPQSKEVYHVALAVDSIILTVSVAVENVFFP